MKVLIVTDKFNNKLLIPYLMKEFPNISQNIFYKALRKRDIRINGKRISENIILNTGDEIRLFISDEYLSPVLHFPDIIYEDENILIVNKPKGIEIVGQNSINSILKNSGYKVTPCHRLDRNTSGLVIFAKSENVLNILLEKFKNQEICKYYKCKVYGILNKKHDILEAYLFKDSKKSLVYISEKHEKGYKKIITEYNVIGENLSKNISTLDIILHTGRTHQIRAHLAYIGHPIIGDRKIWK